MWPMTLKIKILIGIDILLYILLAWAVARAADTAELMMKAGADYRAALTWTDTKTGAPVDITGRSYSAQFRSDVYPAGILYANYSCIVTDATHGKMRISLSRRQTAALSKKTGVWDLKQTAADGTVTYRFGGAAKVVPTVTTP